MSNRHHKYLNNALFFFYALFIFGSTFSIALAQIALGFALTLFIVVAITARHNPFVSSLKCFYVLVGSYVIWLFLTGLIGATPVRSAFMLREDWLFCIVPIGIFLFQDEHSRRRLMLIFAAGVLLMSVYGIIQHFTGIHWLKTHALIPAEDFGFRSQGSFTHRLTYGNYYCVAALSLLGFGLPKGNDLTPPMRVFLILAAILAIIATIFSYSRGPILAVIVSLVFAGVIMGRKYLLSLIGALVVTTVVIGLSMPGLADRFSGTSTDDIDVEYEGSRLFIWKNSLEIVRNHPLFGVGTGNFQIAYASHLDPDVPDFRKHAHAHNDLLNIAAISGLPGMILFAALWL
ncbi:MAG: O-antigen ligase family protein, partial [candidate division Zixibacteria bacterium]|nr:O-antigen ligase family protein [candidate division Zixibacteria bacterium]